MALTIADTYFDACGKERFLSGAYVKVETVTSNKKNAIAHVFFYGSCGAARADRPDYKNQQYNFMPPKNARNFVKQAYVHLKTLPNFVNAVDC